MHPLAILLVGISLAGFIGSTFASKMETPSPNPTTTLWYDKPGVRFTDGLPLGNGRLGMTVFGDPTNERIVLNEVSMWSGSKAEHNKPDAHKNLEEIRRLLLEGKNAEAEELVNRTFTCAGRGESRGKAATLPFGCYQIFGNLWITDLMPREVTGFQRSLDLRDAVARVSYERGGVRYSREMFVSAPDQVAIVRLSADKPGAISLDVELERPGRAKEQNKIPYPEKQVRGEGARTEISNGDMLMTGNLTDGKGGAGVSYAGRLRVLNKGGTVTPGEKLLKVEGADEVTLLIAGETDYQGNVPRERVVADPVAKTLEVVDAAAKKPFEQMLATHKKDHRSWFERAVLSLGGKSSEASDVSLKPTNERLMAFAKSGKDPALAALYFNFGRYLLISSSRPGTLPANLQGIWCEDIQPPWNCDWHLNVNVQMNYWLANPTGLAECHMPLLKLIDSLREPGRATAKAYYNAPGWVAHHATNAWGFTSPGSSATYGSFSSGGPWLCGHLWNHYAFTGDREYLAWAYPVMKESAEFYLASLIEEPKNKWLVTAPSNSPENAFILPDGSKAHVCMGPTMDMQILRELFGNCIAASEILGVDEDFRKKLRQTSERLAPNLIGPDGRLQEWLEPYAETQPGHRHVSHLYGLHPAGEISIDKTPELAAAARKSLERRGDAGTGWSLAWKVNFWARLRDGDRAEKIFRNLLKASYSLTDKEGWGRSGSYWNLWCAHPPFQIDGNLGGTAGIAEMLLQSRWSGKPSDPAEIQILPALPKAWSSGEIQGLRARGGLVVDMKWDNGQLVSATIHSPLGNDCVVAYGDKSRALEMVEDQKIELGANL